MESYDVTWDACMALFWHRSDSIPRTSVLTEYLMKMPLLGTDF